MSNSPTDTPTLTSSLLVPIAVLGSADDYGQVIAELESECLRGIREREVALQKFEQLRQELLLLKDRQSQLVRLKEKVHATGTQVQPTQQ